MNFLALESAQKLRGGFYTEPDLASFLVRWVLERKPKSILEPSCGDGAFLDAILAQPGGRESRVLAWELDPTEAAKAEQRARRVPDAQIDVRTGDFLKWFLFSGDQADGVDAVVGNPPFIRYQYWGEEQQFIAERIFARLGLPFTRHTNAWVPFVLASLKLLTPGGRLAMVIPSEILHIRHAQALRQQLTASCSTILLLDPVELMFGRSLQGVVLMLAEKKPAPEDRGWGVALAPVAARSFFSSDTSSAFAGAEFVDAEGLGSKWMRVLLSGAERALLDGLRGLPRFPTFEQLADVDVGIVTGANSFFLVPDQVVETHELHRWAHPMFGRSGHVPGLIYTVEDHAANRRTGLPANFLWFDDMELNAFPSAAQAYLRSGVEQDLPKRYKCRVREPWFRVPSVYATPLAMLKRCHHFPRIILNQAGAFTTDTAYRIRPKHATPNHLVQAFVNSLTCLSAELEGRHYGGGVLELVPSEIERLPIPTCEGDDNALRVLDAKFRSCARKEDLLLERDQVILRATGLSDGDCSTLHAGWDRLRRRRQRNSTIEESGEGGL